MPDTEWIRPDGCEGGACVEYRTVDGRVFVRNSDQPEELMEFSVAEWDTFVAGLTAPIWRELHEAEAACGSMEAEADGAHRRYQMASNECDSLRKRLTTATAERDKLGQDYVRVMTERDNLAAENARLRQERDHAVATRDTFRSLQEFAEGALTEVLNQRDAAIAEAAVLRHRDRRTQTVVEAAVAWRDASDGYAAQSALVAAVDALREAKLCICRPTHRVDDPICQYVPEAGRAGEAQTITDDELPEWERELLDRQSAMDAAVEAARNAGCKHIDDYCLPAPCLECRIRAASPLIERAALNAAASELAGGTGTMWYGEPPPYLVEVCANWLRDRATRTETP